MDKYNHTSTPIIINSNQSPHKGQMLRLFVISFISVIGILGLSAFGYTLYYTLNQNQILANKLKTVESGGSVAGANTESIASEAIRQMAESTRLRVESMVLIPETDEVPRFAQIDDLSKVSKEPFFRDVAVGDHLLIYQKIGIAILFRPSKNKILTMTYVNPEDSLSPPAQPSADSTLPPQETVPTEPQTGGIMPPTEAPTIEPSPTVDATPTTTPDIAP